ncbi:NAD-dependent epimerase/dehydratase family protein [Tellurirhabdus bombi]|uniref:NAD-dependent epimerase/dehydratase family protein n=1 Tax=Tellurirhabdus bombi TaxID=2907205 RepID=UPI001F23D978|nr:NAD-dependent epimerase/dehydratase family protein [Tellurirhabdus bombi]
MNILITGGAGFIGSHLSERLLAQGHTVCSVDNFNDSYDPLLKRRHIEACRLHPNYYLLEADIRNQSVLETLFKTHAFDAVIHLAALAGVRASLANPQAYVDTNVSGTLTLLECMRRAGVRKLLFASSSSVYGNSMQLPFREDDPVRQPISPYAITKRTCELLCGNYASLYGIDTFCLRFFTVYGPRQRPEMAISSFMRRMLDGDLIEVFGDGSTSRDYTYVGDIVEGILQALQAIKGFEIFNLGSSQPITLRDLIHTIEQVVGKKALLTYCPEQPGDVERTYADSNKAAQWFGYKPKTSLLEGLQQMLPEIRSSLRYR